MTLDDRVHALRLLVFRRARTLARCRCGRGAQRGPPLPGVCAWGQRGVLRVWPVFGRDLPGARAPRCARGLGFSVCWQVRRGAVGGSNREAAFHERAALQCLLACLSPSLRELTLRGCARSPVRSGGRPRRLRRRRLGRHLGDARECLGRSGAGSPNRRPPAVRLPKPRKAGGRQMQRLVGGCAPNAKEPRQRMRARGSSRPHAPHRSVVRTEKLAHR